MRSVKDILSADEFLGEWDSLTKLKAVVLVEQELGIQFKTEELAELDCLLAMEAKVWGRQCNPPQRIIKCIVVDLDGVVWEGVLGEDGVEGITFKAAHQAIHTVLLEFKNRGVMLAICSKNEIKDVKLAFEKRIEMLLSLDMFCSVKCGWESKATYIRYIANELHIGLDSVCFIDDSPHERSLVRSMLPEVMVPSLGEDVRTYAAVIEGLELGLDITSAEDLCRSEMIKKDQARLEGAKGMSKEEYLIGLNQVLYVEELNAGNVERAAQLTQRANQFHLDLRRWSTDDLLKLDKCFVYHLQDRFGDAGRTGVAGFNGEQIEVLVVSCRALGRGVEHAIIHHIVGEVCGTAKALWMPGLRNSQVCDAMRALKAQITWVDEYGPREAVFQEWEAKGGPSWVKVLKHYP